MRGKLSIGTSRRWFLVALLSVLALLAFGIRAAHRWTHAPAPTLIKRLSYTPQQHRPLDLSLPGPSLNRPLRIFHVTKEFGPASMGGEHLHGSLDRARTM